MSPSRPPNRRAAFVRHPFGGYLAEMLHHSLRVHEGAFAGRTACVTGGAGFIGSHLSDALVEAGAVVRILDDFSNGRESNLRGSSAVATVVRGSILDEAALDRAIEGADVVFHHAALGSVPRSLEIPSRYHENNVTGTVRVLEAARRHGVRRFVYAASSSAYGNTATLPKVESMRPDTLSPYAYTKLAGELITRSWANCYGIEAICLRYFNIFGPRQRHDSPYAAVVPIFAERLRRGEPPVIYGDGTQSRDFTFVANAVHANLLAGRTDAALCGQTVNVACGTRFSLLDLVNRLSGLVGSDVPPEFRAARTGDVRDSEADIAAAGALIGYSPVVPFEEGLRITVDSLAAARAPVA